MQNRYQHFQRRLARHVANEIQQPQAVVSSSRPVLKNRDENQSQQQQQQMRVCSSSQSQTKSTNFKVYQESDEEKQ